MSKSKSKGKVVKQDELAKAVKAATKAKPKPAFIGELESTYLDRAIDKVAQPLHPNFVAAVSPSTLGVYARISGVANELIDGDVKLSPKQLAVAIGKRLIDDARTYVTYWTTLMSNVAFAAHMECIALERAVTPEALESSLDAMGDEHDDGEDTQFDRGLDERSAPRETFQPETAANNVHEAYDALANVQEWISLAFVQFTPEQRTYWGIEDLVFLTKRGEAEDYRPVFDFDEYRELQSAQFKAKRRAVKANDALGVMAEA